MTYVRYESKWPDVRVRLERNVAIGVRDTSAALVTQIDEFIQRPPKGGPDLIDTSNYRRSWLMQLAADGLQATIGSPVEYGVYLEYGHYTRKAKANGGQSRSFVLPRPHVRQAAETITRRISEFFRGLDR